MSQGTGSMAAGTLTPTRSQEVMSTWIALSFRRTATSHRGHRRHALTKPKYVDFVRASAARRKVPGRHSLLRSRPAWPGSCQIVCRRKDWSGFLARFGGRSHNIRAVRGVPLSSTRPGAIESRLE